MPLEQLEGVEPSGMRSDIVPHHSPYDTVEASGV